MTARGRGLVLVSILFSAVAPAPRAAADPLPPPPDWILGPRVLATPFLDAVTFCRGVRTDPPHAQVLDMAARSPADALRRVDAWDPSRREAARVLRAALEARLAEGPETLLRARTRLRQRLTDEAPRGLRPCGYLELARLELQLGLYPEAAASTRRAQQLAEDPGARSAIRESTRLLRAEALYLGQRRDAAKEIYSELSGASHERIARAARLRLADVSFDEQAPATVLDDYLGIFAEERPFGGDPLRWAPRVAEAAIAEGELDIARRWLVELLEREGSRQRDAASWIRLADVRAAQGRADGSRALLSDLDQEHAGTPVGMLARVRIFDLGSEKMATDAALRALRRVLEESPHPGIAAYARYVLGRRLLDHGDLDGALPLLLRAAFDSSSAQLATLARRELESGLRLAVEDAREDEGCVRLVRRLGGIRSLVIREAEDPAIFQRLGECYEVIGLSSAALDVYRATALAFGAEAARELALHVARASFAVGDVAAARTAARSRLAATGGAARAWQLLLAETQLADGEYEAAADLLGALVVDAAEDAGGARALLLLARATAGAEPSARRRALLFEQLAAREQNDRHAARAALLGAGLHREAGETSEARLLYQRAFTSLPEGAARAEAGYWTAQLASENTTGWETLERTASASAEAPFARLAASRVALEDLRGRLGVGSRAP